MSVVRVIIAGAVGAGKSTFVQTIGEIGTVRTEEIATDETAALKPTTTVALDFCSVNLEGCVLHIYGTPGQARFNFMWEILLTQAQLCLVLVAAHRPESFASTRKVIEFIDRFPKLAQSSRLVLTHTDCQGALSTEAVAAAFSDRDLILVNPRDRDSVLQGLTLAVEPWIASYG
jgi:uncharacterized protein